VFRDAQRIAAENAKSKKTTGRNAMVQAQEDNPHPAAQRAPGEWARLIRKLRWIGLEDEARNLQLAVSTLPPEERGSVSVGPFSTD
jgi:hypothetical protein